MYANRKNLAALFGVTTQTVYRRVKGIEKLIGDRYNQYETSSLKTRIAHENGIPYELAGRLSGSNEEEIKKDAETMTKFLRKKDVPPLAGGDPQKIDDKKTAMKGMLASLKGE